MKKENKTKKPAGIKTSSFNCLFKPQIEKDEKPQNKDKETSKQMTKANTLVWKNPDELTLSPNNVRKNYHEKEVQKLVSDKDDFLSNPEFWNELSEERFATLKESVFAGCIISSTSITLLLEVSFLNL